MPTATRRKTSEPQPSSAAFSGSRAATVREAVADALLAEGVERLFALMGDGNLELICDVGERCGLPVVLGRHEQGVVAMADGYARFSGGPGVATVTQGPGLTNAATSLVVASRHPSPVLLIAGDVPAGDLHNPQRFEQDAFGRLTAGAGGSVDSVRSFDPILARAFATVRAGRPFVLNLPADVQRSPVEHGWRYHRHYGTSQPVCAAPELIEQAAGRLAGARQPALLAGRGAATSGAGPALAKLAEMLGAPLMTTLLAHGLFAAHGLDAGVLGGLGDGRALRAIEHADVIVAVGAGLNQWTTHFGSALDGRVLIQIDTDPAALLTHRASEHLRIQGDAAATVDALAAALSERQVDPRDSLEKVTQIIKNKQPRDPSPYRDTDATVDPRHFLAELDRALPEDRSIVIGGGHAAQVACFTLRASGPSDWSCTSVDFGAIGQGLPVAIGACFARPGRRVIHVTADGDLMMGIAELDTAIRYSVPLTIFVLNDHAMGQEHHNLARAQLPTSYASYPSPDLAELARTLGATGYRIDNAQQLDRIRPALDRHDGVVIVDVRINGDYLNPISREIAAHLS
jgi:acetolactate synthase I/II/III large subunit